MGSKKLFFTLYVFIQFEKGEQDGRRDPWCRHDLQLRASASPGASQRKKSLNIKHQIQRPSIVGAPMTQILLAYNYQRSMKTTLKISIPTIAFVINHLLHGQVVS